MWTVPIALVGSEVTGGDIQLILVPDSQREHWSRSPHHQPSHNRTLQPSSPGLCEVSSQNPEHRTSGPSIISSMLIRSSKEPKAPRKP